MAAGSTQALPDARERRPRLMQGKHDRRGRRAAGTEPAVLRFERIDDGMLERVLRFDSIEHGGKLGPLRFRDAGYARGAR